MHAALVFGPRALGAAPGGALEPTHSLFVVDLDSTHGTFLRRAEDDDGGAGGWTKLFVGVPTPLQDGDTLRLGQAPNPPTT